MTDFIIRAGDTLPVLRIRLMLGPNGYVLSPSATVQVKVQNVETLAVSTFSAVIADRTVPEVQVSFDPSLAPGPREVKYRMWLIVQDGTDTLTVPNAGHDTVVVYPPTPD